MSAGFLRLVPRVFIEPIFKLTVWVSNVPAPVTLGQRPKDAISANARLLRLRTILCVESQGKDGVTRPRRGQAEQNEDRGTSGVHEA